MKTIFLMLPLIAACSLFGSKKDEPSKPSKPGREKGTFHPGPYTDPETGKFCNPPGGFCDADKHCHSSPDKCLK